MSEWVSKASVILNQDDMVLITGFAPWLRLNRNTNHRWPLYPIIRGTVEHMIENGLIDPNRPQENAPTIGEILAWTASLHKLIRFNIRISGYLTICSEDRGVTLDTIHMNKRQMCARKAISSTDFGASLLAQRQAEIEAWEREKERAKREAETGQKERVKNKGEMSSCPWMAGKQRTVLERAEALAVEERYSLNDDDKARIMCLAPNLYQSCGELWYYRRVNLQTLKEMAAMGLTDPNDHQEFAPTFGEILAWLIEHPSFTAHGFIKVGRPDRRITIEGVAHEGEISAEEAAGFRQMFRRADELNVRKKFQRAWFD